MTEYEVVRNRRLWPLRNVRRVYYAIYNPLKFFYLQGVKPDTNGVKILVKCTDMVLLVRVGYSHKGWVLPGGSVDQKETPKAAVLRELYEESGVQLNGVQFLETKEYYVGGRKKILHYFFHEAERCFDLAIDDQEIIDAGWFSLSTLPNEQAPSLARDLVVYKSYGL